MKTKNIQDYFQHPNPKPLTPDEAALVEYSGMAALERHQRAQRMAWLVAVSIAFLAVMLITA